jgi:hypothetical protein
MRRVVVTENGRRKTITKLDAIAKHLVSKAAACELRSMKQLCELLRYWNDAPIGRHHLHIISERDARLVDGRDQGTQRHSTPSNSWPLRMQSAPTRSVF